MVKFLQSLWSISKSVAAWLALEDVGSYIIEKCKGVSDADSETMCGKIMQRVTGESESDRTLNGTITREDLPERAMRDGILNLGSTNFADEVDDGVIKLLVAYQEGAIPNPSKLGQVWMHMGTTGGGESASADESLRQLRCAWMYLMSLSGPQEFVFDEDTTTRYLSSLMTTGEGDDMWVGIEAGIADIANAMDANEDHIINTTEMLKDPSNRRVADFYMLMLSAMDYNEGDSSDVAETMPIYYDDREGSGQFSGHATIAPAATKSKDAPTFETVPIDRSKFVMLA